MDPPADTLQESGGHVPPRTGSDSAASLLSTWDRAAKEREVGWCIQGLAQLGFAWDRMDREVEGVEKILEESLRAQEQAQAQGYA